MYNTRRNLGNEKGVTLLELLIVVPMVVIIIIISYNLLVLSTKSFNYTKNTFSSGEDIRVFVNNIHKEASQAKKQLKMKQFFLNQPIQVIEYCIFTLI